MTRHRTAAARVFAFIIISTWTSWASAQSVTQIAAVAGPERPSPSDETAMPQAEPADFVEELLQPFRRERSRLKELGITFKLHEQSEIWGDLTGGGRRGLSYNGLTVAKLDIDLGQAIGWSDAEFFVSAFDIDAHGPTRSLVGNQQLVSNNEARPSDKLYDLWLEQGLFDKRLHVRIGQEGANDELMISQYGALFLNASFGVPGMPAADLPSGGPNYPMTTPFARLKYQATDNVTLVGAVFNGDPAPPGPGDPQIRDRNGTAFRLNDHSLAFGEIWYSPEPGASDALPTTYKLGTWYSSSHFADQRIDSAGGLLASPASTGRALQHTGDWAIYGIVDQMVWKRSGTEDQGIGVFLQVMGGPSDRNLSNLFIESGVNWLAPFPERKDDVFGLAFAYLGISPAARRFSREFIAFGGAGSVYATNETVVEATYTAPITSYLTLQPDIQLVLNPGAGIPGPFGRRSLADAVIIGTRATIKF
jgi:porin